MSQDNAEKHATVITRAEQNLQRQLDWIGRYDARSATILGVGIAMLGFLASEAPPPEKWGLVCYLAAIAAVAPIVISLAGIYFGQIPRTNSPNDSLIYFATIAKTKVEDFQIKFRDQSDEQHLWDLCHQAHINSTLISKKFAALKVALIAILVAVLPWVFAIIWFRITKA